MKYDIKSLTIDEKIAMLTGSDYWHTRCKRQGRQHHHAGWPLRSAQQHHRVWQARSQHRHALSGKCCIRLESRSCPLKR